MANIIYIDFKDNDSFLDFPLLEDVQVTIENEYEALGDLIPSLGDLMGYVTTLQTLGSGGMGKGTSKMNNLIAFKRWKNTNPLKINVKLLFYIKTDAYSDVILNMNKFIERSTLSFDGEGKVSVPGLSLSQIMERTDAKQQTSLGLSAKQAKSFSTRSKLVDIIIPGTVQIPNAFIESISPTYSRQTTADGTPIWGMLDIQFSGTIPATYDNNFNNVPYLLTEGGIRFLLSGEKATFL